MRKFVSIFLISFISISSTLSAETVAKWRVQGSSVVLESTTNLANPSQGKSAVIALTYEKSFFKCKPSLAFLSFEGLKLGTGIKQKTSKSKKNQLTFYVNKKKFIAQKETKMNTYSNGIELVAFFNESILRELSKPSLIKVSVGGKQPVMEFKTSNSITPSIGKISDSCN